MRKPLITKKTVTPRSALPMTCRAIVSQGGRLSAPEAKWPIRTNRIEQARNPSSEGRRAPRSTRFGDVAAEASEAVSVADVAVTWLTDAAAWLVQSFVVA